MTFLWVIFSIIYLSIAIFFVSLYLMSIGSEIKENAKYSKYNENQTSNLKFWAKFWSVLLGIFWIFILPWQIAKEVIKRNEKG